MFFPGSFYSFSIHSTLSVVVLVSPKMVVIGKGSDVEHFWKLWKISACEFACKATNVGRGP